jgi:hypothetical protein
VIPIPACNVLVAPRTGRLESTLPEDSVVSQGDVVAVMEAGSERVSLRAPAAGIVGGALVGIREALDLGDGVLWMRFSR